MKRILAFILAAAVFAGGRCIAQISEFHLPLGGGLERADIYVSVPQANPRAVLVLCPGVNLNGRYMVADPVWSDFAKQEHLALVGLSFASPEDDLMNGRGYYYASQGSGQILLDGIRKALGRDFPMLLYGMSGGAHFTSRFVEWNPQRVVTWCAYSAAWWDKPRQSDCAPPGIVACGDADPRYGATLSYFLEGRALGKPWTWVSLAGIEHKWNRPLDNFVRDYFAAILADAKAPAEWRDIDLKVVLDPSQAKSQPVLACWLPDKLTAEKWMAVHQP